MVKIDAIYLPLLEIIAHGKNRRIRKISCLVDTGAGYNIFPSEIGLTYFGMSEKTLAQGKPLHLRGIGNIELDKPAYGHLIKLQHPYFNFKTWVFFIDKQYPPLLGRSGFMDKFRKLEFDEINKKLILELR